MNKKENILKNSAVQSLLASLMCILVGMLVGFIALLIINPSGAVEAILDIIRNYFNYPSAGAQMKYLGNTLVRTAPLLLCSLSVLLPIR